MQTSTIVAASVGTASVGILAYLVYFDYRRRNDPNFRKALKRDHRKLARAQKEQAEAESLKQKEAVRNGVKKAREAGFPTEVEEKEAYFMNEVAKGEELVGKGDDNAVEAALCFYKALKVYPNPRDLISIYDKTVPKPVLDILAEMIANDPTISVGGFGGPSSDAGIGVE